MQNNNHSVNGAAASPGFLSADASLTVLLTAARRRWRWLALSLGIGWVLAGIYYLTAAPEYESTAKVLVMRKDPSLATTGSQATNESEARVSEDLLATHIQLVQSLRIINQALSDVGLDQLSSITEKLGEKEKPADYVIDNLYVSRGGSGQSKTAHVIEIAFHHTSAEDAKIVVDAIVKSYQQFLGEKFQDVNKEAADLIASAQQDLANQLQQAETQYTGFRQRAPLLWKGDESSNVHRERYEQIQTELGELQLQATDTKSRLDVVQQGLVRFKSEDVSDIELLALIDEKSATRLGILVQVDRGEADTAEFQSRQPARLETARAEYESLITLKLKLGTLLQDYGPEHPEVITTRQQIATLEDFLEKKSATLGFRGEERLVTPKLLIDAYVKLLQQDLSSIQKRQTELTELADKQAELAKALVSYELEGESLRKAVGRKQELYDAVVDRLREINLAKDYGGFINEVIEEPELGEKVSPKLAVVGFLGTLGGLALSIALVVLAELSDRSFRTSDEIHQVLGLPVLTHIPDLAVDSDGKAAAAVAASGSRLDLTLRTYHRPKSREAEIFRGLRTNLFFNAGSKKIQVIECTSPNQGDGKSTLAGNLSISIAQTGRKVLIVDCDMRRPRIHEMFALSNELGLADVISQEADPWDVIRRTEVDHLSALTCGTIPNNPAELLTSPEFENFLNLVRDRYEYIILDCPPILVVADPCIVAPRVDGVVMAVRVSRDSRPQTVRAQQSLAEVGASVLGVVVNCWDAGTLYGRYGYGQYGTGYNYGYAYGDGKETSNKYYEDSEASARRTPKAQRVL